MNSPSSHETARRTGLRILICRLSHIGDVAAQADLERELRAWCDSASLDVGESTLRAIVVDAIQAHRARQSKP